MKVVNEGRRLAETTSMKGVPRAMKASYLPLKILWIVSVLVFFAVCMYQTTDLLLHYFKYHTITTVQKRRVDLTATDAIQLPELLVCNLNPLSERVYIDDSIPSVEEYVALVENLIDENKDTLDDETVELIRDHFLNVRSYYAHLTPEQAEIVGHAQDEFIVSCKIIMLLGMQTAEVDCIEEGGITLLQHPQYFNCYVIAMGNQTLDAVKVGYSVTLQLDNFNTSWHEYLTEPETFQHGAIAMLRTPNTYPNFLESGHLAAPGKEANIKFHLEKLNELSEPYGTCMSQEEVEIALERFNYSHLDYTPAICANFIFRLSIAARCNCSDLSRFKLTEPDSRVCGLRGKTTTEVIDEVLCQYDALSDINFANISRCPTPCHEVHYTTFYSQSQWPADSVSQTFYKTMIKGKPYERHFTTVKQALEGGHGPGSIEHLTAERIIEKNFLKVRTYLGQQAVFNVTDTPKLTPISLISQMGGTLNLWSGITMILVVEFIDFLVRLFFIKDSPERNREVKADGPEKISLCPVQASIDTDAVQI